MIRSPIPALIALLGGLMQVACALQTFAATPTPSPPTHTPPPSPTALPPNAEETVTEFYGWYTSYPGSVVIDGAYRDNEILRPYLSDEFVERIDTLRRTFDGPDDYDPFLCGQDIPVRLEYAVEHEDGQTAQVRVSRYFGGNLQPYDMLVDLARHGDRWLIVGTHCTVETGDGPPTAPPTLVQDSPPASPTPITEWDTYHNDAYGFQVAYPAAWTPIESFGSRLSESDPVAGYVTFMQGPQGALTPVALVVIAGPEETFRLLFPEPENGHRALYVGGMIVEVEQHFDHETYYFIPHPADETRRVAIRVITPSGQPDRDLENVVGHMLESFDFDD
jgi:hypothetical protein